MLKKKRKKRRNFAPLWVSFLAWSHSLAVLSAGSETGRLAAAAGVAWALRNALHALALFSWLC
jgi:hypothetical protein